MKFQMWDTSGLQRFQDICQTYYRGAHAICIVLDITDEKSFRYVNILMVAVDKHGKEGVHKVLIGNKCDLSSERAVKYEEALEFAKSNGMLYFETSAMHHELVTHVVES